MADELEAKAALIDRLTTLGRMAATQTAVFQSVAASFYGVGLSEMKALDVLTREGTQSAGQLGVALQLSSGAVTGVVDRLVARGFVRRDVDPTDRRRIVVRPDWDALNSGENVYLGIGAAFADLHAGYSSEQLEFLVDYQEASLALTIQETTRLRARVADTDSRST